MSDMSTTEVPMRTVGDRLRRLRDFRGRVANDESITDEQRLRSLARIDRELERLGDFHEDTLLLGPREALLSDALSDEEKFIVRWQRRRDLDLDRFNDSLLTAFEFADEQNLDRLAAAFPTEVKAIRRWRNERGWADRVRGLPISFSL